MTLLFTHLFTYLFSSSTLYFNSFLFCLDSISYFSIFTQKNYITVATTTTTTTTTTTSCSRRHRYSQTSQKSVLCFLHTTTTTMLLQLQLQLLPLPQPLLQQTFVKLQVVPRQTASMWNSIIFSVTLVEPRHPSGVLMVQNDCVRSLGLP